MCIPLEILLANNSTVNYHDHIVVIIIALCTIVTAVSVEGGGGPHC